MQWQIEFYTLSDGRAKTIVDASSYAEAIRAAAKDPSFDMAISACPLKAQGDSAPRAFGYPVPATEKPDTARPNQLTVAGTSVAGLPKEPAVAPPIQPSPMATSLSKVPPMPPSVEPTHFELTDPKMLRGPYYDDLTDTIRIPAHVCHVIVTPLANHVWQVVLQFRWESKAREFYRKFRMEEVPDALKWCRLVFDFFWDIER